MIATYRIGSNYGPGVISFQQFFTPATKWDWRLLLEVLNQSFWVMTSNGSWQRSCSRSARYCAPWNGQYVLQSPWTVWSLVIGEQLVLEKKPPGQSTWLISSASDKGFSDSTVATLHQKIYSQITWYFITRRGSVVRCPTSGHISGRRRRGKGLQVQCTYNFYYGSTKHPAFIWDPACIFVIMLFPPATKRDQAFMRDRP